MLDLLKTEIRQGKLQKVSSDLYKQVAERLKELESVTDGESGISNSIAEEESRILKQLTERLIELRLTKARKSILMDLGDLDLTPEEKYLIEPIIAYEKRRRTLNQALHTGRSSYLEEISQLAMNKYVTVRFKDSTDSIVGTDLKKYGPFEKEDVALIPIENARTLLKQGLLAQVWIDA
ncbi:MAG: hypothetical protein O6846_00135 [Thaumarchaeota archaeon]|nr:hypothetical protein [Nitrososphaerota archaeon]